MPNNDYILRMDALKAVCETCSEHGEEGESCAVHCGDYALIQNIPAADVKPVRHGRWVKMTGMMPPEFTGHYSCSECDWFCKKHSVRETDFDFCPGCGAEMEGKDAE